MTTELVLLLYYTEIQSFIFHSVDPSVELLLVSSAESDQQRLLCFGSGFNPQITWLPGSLQGTDQDTNMRTDGRVVVTSQLTIPQTEWGTGKVFTCEVSDRSLNKKDAKNISFCSGKKLNFHIHALHVKLKQVHNFGIHFLDFL